MRLPTVEWQRRIGWTVAVLVTVYIAYRIIEGPGWHERSLAVSLAGALIMVVPPLRQVMRIRPTRNVPAPDKAKVFKTEVVQGARENHLDAFSEYSNLDVFCWLGGPLLLAAGFFMDGLSESEGHVEKAAVVQVHDASASSASGNAHGR